MSPALSAGPLCTRPVLAEARDSWTHTGVSLQVVGVPPNPNPARTQEVVVLHR